MQMLRHKPNDAVLLGTSLADVVNFLETTPRVWAQSHSQTTFGSSWDLGVGYAGALELARNGWPEGTNAAYDALSARPAPTTAHAKLAHSVAGEYADVGRYLSGNPDNMIARGKVKGNKPVVTIVINGCSSAGVTAEQYKNYGFALCALVDKLEASGRRVELHSIFRSQYAWKYFWACGWKLKGADEPLDLHAMAYSLAHPAAFRRIEFAMEERMPAAFGTHGSYGYLCNIDQAFMNYIGMDDALFINGIGREASQCTTVDAALRFAVKQINLAAGEELATLEG